MSGIGKSDRKSDASFFAEIKTTAPVVTISGFGYPDIPPGYMKAKFEAVRPGAVGCISQSESEILRSEAFFRNADIADPSALFSKIECIAPAKSEGIIDRFVDFLSAGYETSINPIPVQIASHSGDERIYFPALLTGKSTIRVGEIIAEALTQKNGVDRNGYFGVTVRKRSRGSSFDTIFVDSAEKYWYIIELARFASEFVSCGQRKEWGNIVSVPSGRTSKTILSNMISTIGFMFSTNEKPEQPDIVRDYVESEKERLPDPELEALVRTTLDKENNVSVINGNNPNACEQIDETPLEKIARIQRESVSKKKVSLSFLD